MKSAKNSRKMKEVKKSKVECREWLFEADDMEKNSHKYKAYGDVDEMFEDILGQKGRK